MSIIIASGYAAALCIAQLCVSRPQAKLRPKGPKIETAGRYYNKDQADSPLVVFNSERFVC